MSDTSTIQSEQDIKTRANLAYIWSIAIIIMIAFVLYKWGSILAVLTLVVGFVTGTAATILSVYFGAPIASKKADTTVTQTGDSPVTNVTPAPGSTADVPPVQPPTTS
jgi:hypothetical protein